MLPCNCTSFQGNSTFRGYCVVSSPYKLACIHTTCDLAKSIIYTNTTVCLMSGLWRKDKTIQVWYLKKPCEAFRNKYNKIQEQLKQLCCMDELLSGKPCIIN